MGGTALVIKKNRKKKRLQIKLLIFFALALAAVLMVDSRLRPIISRVTSAHAKAYATSAVNQAVARVMAEKAPEYRQLVQLTYNEDGAVSALTTDMAQLNLLQADITAHLVQSVVEFTSKPVKVPLGSLVGGQFLSGRGPVIEIQLVPAGFVETNIANYFQTAGINQVRHSLMMTVRINLTAILPGYGVDATVDQELVLAETVIVGLVPDAYTVVADQETASEPMVGIIQDYGAHQMIDLLGDQEQQARFLEGFGDN